MIQERVVGIVSEHVAAQDPTTIAAVELAAETNDLELPMTLVRTHAGDLVPHYFGASAIAHRANERARAGDISVSQQPGEVRYYGPTGQRIVK